MPAIRCPSVPRMMMMIMTMSWAVMWPWRTRIIRIAPWNRMLRPPHLHWSVICIGIGIALIEVSDHRGFPCPFSDPVDPGRWRPSWACIMRDRIEIPNGVTLYPCRPTSSLVHRCRGGVIGRFTLCLVLKTYLVLLLSSKTYIENSNKLNLNFLSGKRKTIAIVALLVMAVTLPPPPIRPPYPAPPPVGWPWWRIHRHRRHPSRNWVPKRILYRIWPANIPNPSTISYRKSTRTAHSLLRRNINRRISTLILAPYPLRMATDRCYVTPVRRPVRWRSGRGTNCFIASAMPPPWAGSSRRRRTRIAPADPWRRPLRCWPIPSSKMNSL